MAVWVTAIPSYEYTAEQISHGKPPWVNSPGPAPRYQDVVANDPNLHNDAVCLHLKSDRRILSVVTREIRSRRSSGRVSLAELLRRAEEARASIWNRLQPRLSGSRKVERQLFLEAFPEPGAPRRCSGGHSKPSAVAINPYTCVCEAVDCQNLRCSIWIQSLWLECLRLRFCCSSRIPSQWLENLQLRFFFWFRLRLQHGWLHGEENWRHGCSKQKKTGV